MNNEFYLAIWDFVLGIPKTLSVFASWLFTPIDPLINISPILLLSSAGVGVIIFLISIHVARLFV